MKTWVLIVIALLALATVLVWTFATAALYRRGQCRTYPYYWCDTSWACCSKANVNATCTAAGGTTGDSYKVTDKFYGTNKSAAFGDDDHNLYYHLCIAPANAIIASNPASSLNCLYNSSTCNFTNPIPNPDDPLNPYTNIPYVPSDCLLGPIGLGCYGLGGRCEYYSIDDPPPPTTTPGPITYNYLPSYPAGGTGTGYAQNPSLSGLNTSYFFAGNSGPTDTTGISWNNGPKQADSTSYSAWNRLGNIAAGPP